MPRFSTRGRGLLAAGISVLICGMLLQQRDLVRIGVLAVALPGLCWVWLRFLPLRTRTHREVSPGRVQPGGMARVHLDVVNDGPWPIGPVAMLDVMPNQLGPGARFAIGLLPAGHRRTVAYSVRPRARGKWSLGPLRTRLGDPFGLVTRTVESPELGSLIAYPRIEQLGRIPAGGASGSGEASAGTVAAAGVHDLAVREYRHGDDLRRVHWRSTARHGELMVRTDEQPYHRRAGVILDARAGGHRGAGMESSFEPGVVAAASLCEGLALEAYHVRLSTGEPATQNTLVEQLDHLAVVTLDGDAALREALSQVRATTLDDGMTVAVLGELTQSDVAELCGFVASARPAHRPSALLLATEEYQSDQGLARRLRERREAAAADLEQAGWMCVTLSRELPLAQAWELLQSRPVRVLR